MARSAEVLTVLIEEAETALHQLATGEQAVEVRDSDGSSVRYTPANMGRLKSYLRDLRLELEEANGNRQIYRPIGFQF